MMDSESLLVMKGGRATGDLMVYKCPKCGVYFEAYSQALKHLKLKHDLKVELVKSIELPLCNISVERMKMKDDKSVSSSSTTTTTSMEDKGLTEKKNNDEGEITVPPGPAKLGKKKPANNSTIVKDGERIEIKLDNFKASEIETLLKNRAETTEGTEKSLIPRGRGRPRNPVVKFTGGSDSDADYQELEEEEDNSSSSNEDEIEDEEDMPQPTRVRKRSKKRRPHNHPCPQCGKLFPAPYDVRQHVEKVHERKNKKPPGPKKTYACPLCEKSYDILTSLKDHFIIHLKNNPFVCKMSGCGSKFQNRKSLQRHVKLHIGEKRFKCDKCTYAYVRRDSLLQHQRQSHGKRKTSYSITQFQKVKRVKIGKDLNPKDDNDHVGSGSDDYSDDQDQERQNPPVKIKEEPDEFLRIEVGSQHFDDTGFMTLNEAEDIRPETHPIKSEHKSSSSSDSEEEEDEEYQDEDLMPSEHHNLQSLRSLTLKDPVYLKLLAENPEAAALVLTRHDKSSSLEIEKGKKIFTCSLCSWEGALLQNFRMHMKNIHNQDFHNNPEKVAVSGELAAAGISLLCGKCGYSPTSSDDLAEHMNKKHPVNGTYPCHRCHVRVKDAETLKEHEIKVHFSEKKLQCPHCPKRYATPHGLKDHIDMKHGPPGNFMCGVCKTGFNNRLHLLAHKKSAHKRTAVKCKACGVKCCNKYVLEKHVSKYHGKTGKGKESSSSTPTTTSGQQNNTEEVDEDEHKILGL